ncbi:hypothetical protein DXD15_14500 [Blautia sp. TF11-31AT]|nr:hypothetical protein DXD15_14500 [Blautia sp. TF11-31AT]
MARTGVATDADETMPLPRSVRQPPAKGCLTLRGRGIVSGYWKAAGMYGVDSVEFRILQAIIVFFWGIRHIENQEARGL